MFLAKEFASSILQILPKFGRWKTSLQLKMKKIKVEYLSLKGRD